MVTLHARLQTGDKGQEARGKRQEARTQSHEQRTTFFCLLLLVSCLLSPCLSPAWGQGKRQPTEADYYQMVTFPLPKEVVLEVGGMDWLDKAKTKLAVCARRGEVWLVQNPYAKEPVLATSEDAKKAGSNVVRYKRMLFGLHEPLGLLVRPEGIFMAQRSELTRVKDSNGDDLIDEVETFCNDWQISGSYHEYAFGPKVGPKGDLWVTLNRPFGGQPEGKALWRGWCVRIDKKGKMHPVCTGLRSPAGLGANHKGDMFYTDNQGDWVAVCKLAHLKEGSYHGNPTGLDTCGHPLANVKRPEKIPNGLPMAEAAKKIANLQLPAVWFPYPQMGRSHSDVLWDSTKGKFGPFEKQIFVGDQANSIVVRCFLEKVGGEYQGACFPFREGFQCGVMRMCWGKDGSMFCGQTARGWGSRGRAQYGLQRLVWTGKVPFEIKEMRAKPNGYEVTFTKGIDPKTAGKISSYALRCWTYNLHNNYGCKPKDTKYLKVTKVTVDEDNNSVRLTIPNMPVGYVHELRVGGVRSSDGLPVLHPIGYYTFNRKPKG